MYICALNKKSLKMIVEKMTERLDPLNDFLFLKFMGEKGDEVQLLAFLNAVLQRTGKDHLKSIEIIGDTKLSAEIIGDKSSVLDVRAVTDDHTHVNIEVQLRNLGTMDRRSLFYWSRDYSKSIDAGDDYAKLPNIIAINIVNYEFLPSIEDFHTSFHLREDAHTECILTEALEIHFIDMVKFRRLCSRDITQNSLHRWLTFFDKHAKPEIVKEVINMDMAIQKAYEKINFLSSDKEALRAYHMREMAMSDFTSGINFARREGMQKGLQKGLQKGRQEGMQKGMQEGLQKGMQETLVKLAKKMKVENVPFAIIQKCTGFSIDEIEHL
jgi:predicted transposase/invertase (TIGR01784 family)